MKARYLLAGISAMAFAATAASAQNTNSANSSGTGNTAVCTNNTLGSTGNTCDIDIVGDNNDAAVTQAGDNNDGSIDIVGDGNSANIVQPGDNNNATIVQRDTNNSATIAQSGRWNSAGVTQEDDLQVATVYQSSFSDTVSGDGNIATVTQRGTGPDEHDHNQVFAEQRGEDNILTVDQQAGSVHNTSQSIQGGNVGADGTPLTSGTGFGNTITVTQGGASNYAYTEQRSADSEGSVLRNDAIVTMGQGTDQGFNGSTNNLSSITQSTSDNFARNAVFGGELQGNSSTIIQRTGDRNEADVSVARAGAEASVRGNQQTSNVDQNGRDNYATVTITGGLAGNNVTNDVTPGQGAEGGRSGGNSVLINQNGGANTAATTTGNTRQAFRGFGNSATITQNTTANYANQTVNEGSGTGSANLTTTGSADRLAYREFNTSASSNNFAGARGNYVETWQQGRFDTLTVTQADNANGSGVIYGGDGTDPNQIGRARAAVYQNSSVGQVTIDQTGDNYGEVTQGVGTEAFAVQGNVATLTQIDSGDDSTPGTAGGTTTVIDEFGNPGTVTTPPGGDIPVRTYNQALLTQHGLANEMTVTQNAENGYVSAFQRTGTTNLLMQVEQGTGTTAAYSAATPDTGAISATTTVGASHTATANVEQGGTNNGVRVRQDSSNSVVNVLQLGTGDSPVTDATFGTGVFAGQAGGNVIQVIQQGDGNRATAVQRAGVARSDCTNSPGGCPASGNSQAQNEAETGVLGTPADDFFFAGGERSAEIDILQGGEDNTARAEQRGAGQYARIEQAGSNNAASILQDVGATNATAIIRQTGSNNTYNIYQNQPGQYVAVDQTGNNNGTRVGRGANTGSGFDGTGSSPLVPPAGSGVN